MLPHWALIILAFAISSLAAYHLALYLKKLKFPLITGLILTGMILGGSILNFIPTTSITELHYLSDIALAMIAFTAGSELFLKDLVSRKKSIKWMTGGQLLITFVLSTVFIYFVADRVPFMKDLEGLHKWGIAILFASIFVARSPSSAIAIVKEQRASGPFTKTAIGVTVIIDVLVIILFAICFSFAKTMINGEAINIIFLGTLLLEIALSIGLGIVLGWLLIIPFTFNAHSIIKGALILALGYGAYALTGFATEFSELHFPFEIRLEPLLMCITGAYVLTNYSKNREEFAHILEFISPIVYVVFFTYTGASLSLEVVGTVFGVAMLFFGLRIVTLFLGGVASVFLAKDNPRFALVSWMPYVTQAGVALGLTALVSKTFPEWGAAFESIIIAIVVINQIVGPPLFKWALGFVKETNTKHDSPGFDGIKDIYIFGLENQSLILASELAKKNWEPKIFTLKKELDANIKSDISITQIPNISIETLKSIEIEKADRVLCLLNDDSNYSLTELLYEQVGTDMVIVRLEDDNRADEFKELGALVIQPSLAIISLMDHMLRSPNTTSFLLGIDSESDTLDIPINNKAIIGLSIREMQLPQSVVILSIKRRGDSLVPHGYTKLALGDVLAVAGPSEEISKLFEYYSGDIPFAVNHKDF